MFQQAVRNTEVFEDLRSSSGEDSYCGSYGQWHCSIVQGRG